MIDVTESELLASLHVQRWVDDVAAAAPFADWAALRGVAHDAATPLSPAEIDEAVAAHPRIGESPDGDGGSPDGDGEGDGLAERFSTAEQQSPDVDDEHLAKALAEGNATYEKRFGRVFLIRAAGRSRAEIVDELERRLKLDEESELAIVGEELRDIALLRLETLHGGDA